MLVLSGPGVAGAQSPTPSDALSSGGPSTLPSTSAAPPSSAAPSSPGVPSSPGASATAADCTAAAALLPASLDDLPLDATTSPGVAAIDPDELLDPLLAALGRGRSDVCVVAFRYGGAPDALAGQLLRIADVSVPDLAARFAVALRDQLVAYGDEASPQVGESAGQVIWTLGVTADGAASQVVVTQLDDMLLLTTGMPAMERLAPLLVKASTPEP